MTALQDGRQARLVLPESINSSKKSQKVDVSDVDDFIDGR